MVLGHWSRLVAGLGQWQTEVSKRNGHSKEKAAVLEMWGVQRWPQPQLQWGKWEKWGKWENQPLCQVGQQREGTGAAQPHGSWKTVM